MKKIAIVFLVSLLFITGCAKSNTSNLYLDNEIISYEPLDEDKIIISLFNGMNINSLALENALEEKFPQIEIVTSFGGGDPYLRQQAKNNELPDILFYSHKPNLSELFYDLSSLPITNRYNLTSLDAISVDDKIYQLPVASSGVGIFYNKTLFDEKGWSIPDTLDEFYELCDVIESEGIRPFAPCFKYASTVADVGLGLSSKALFGNITSSTGFYDFVNGKRSSKGVLEPFLASLRELYLKGLVTEDDFTSSVTQNRLALYNGEIAMIPYSLNFVSFYDTENPDCEIGFMGFPTDVKGERYLALSHDDTCMSLSKYSMEDVKKKQILLDILDFLSTNEGQSVLFECFTGISSVKTYQSNIASRFEEVLNCIDHGRMYFPQQIWTNDDLGVIKEWITTDMDMDEMLNALDEIIIKDTGDVGEIESIGTATETFSVMETCQFMASEFVKATNADIGLVLYKTSYKGVLMKLYEGDIVYPEVFYIRGVNSKNYLTVYEITGKALKELLEHPYVNGVEVNATYISSGLKITYAPWNDLNNNIIEVTLSDGTMIVDDKIYKVAAWDTTIDEKYISSVYESYEEYNHPVAFMTNVIKEMKVVSPLKEKSVILKWK